MGRNFLKPDQNVGKKQDEAKPNQTNWAGLEMGRLESSFEQQERLISQVSGPLVRTKRVSQD